MCRSHQQAVSLQGNSRESLGSTQGVCWLKASGLHADFGIAVSCSCGG
jgi:hypothetical protein